jgi:hypothetical protein
MSITMKFRTSRFRLLASMLVMLAVLGNGMSLAQAQVTPSKKPCCLEMLARQMSAQDSHHAKQPCAPSTSSCDDQCMLRCYSANGLLSTPLVILAERLVVSPIPAHKLTMHARRAIDPGLRPPIYS